MALKFACTNCNNQIVVRYLKVGDQALCKSCGETVTVLEEAKGAPDYQAQIHTSRSNLPPSLPSSSAEPGSALASFAFVLNGLILFLVFADWLISEAVSHNHIMWGTLLLSNIILLWNQPKSPAPLYTSNTFAICFVSVGLFLAESTAEGVVGSLSIATFMFTILAVFARSSGSWLHLYLKRRNLEALGLDENGLADDSEDNR